MAKPDSWTEQTFLSAVRNGGPQRDAALQWWFSDNSLHAWVRGYTKRNGGSEADGEDLYHDTFITFDRLLREGKYRGEAALKTYFCSIAKWQWLNRLRKMGRTLSMEQADTPEPFFFSEEEMYRSERQRVFEQLLGSLGQKCKRLLTLYQLHYSMKEIAAEMGYQSEQVAMNQSSECRKKLKALIENSPEIKDFLNLS